MIRTEIAEREDLLYYAFYIGEWQTLAKPILPKERGLAGAGAKFTNKFLLEHSEYIPELQMSSAEQYRFYSELKRTANSEVINESGQQVRFEYGDVEFVFQDGQILAMENDVVLDQVSVVEFAKKPGKMMRRLERYVRGIAL